MTSSIDNGGGRGGGSGGGGRWLVLRVVLSVVPFLGMCGAVPLVNQVEPYVLGLPFLVFWIGLWTVLTSVCMGLVHLLAPPEAAPPEPAPAGPASAAAAGDEGRRS